MPVPNPAAKSNVGGTNLVSGALASVNIQGNSAEAFGATSVNLGGAFDALARGLDNAARQQSAVERSAAFAEMDDYTTELDQELTELSRNRQPGTDNYYETAAGVVQNAQDKFMADRIPPHLRDEFGARVNSISEAAKRRAYDEGLKAEDDFFRGNLDKAAVTAGNGFDTGGWTQKQADDYFAERLDATNLVPEEKAKILLAQQTVIAKMGYQKAYKAELASGEISAETLIRGFESFQGAAYMDKNATTGADDRYRAGYGSDFVIRADGSRENVTASTRVSAADAERTLQYRLRNEFEPRARDQVGSNAWQTLPQSARAALLSVAWNYGNLPDTVVKAAKSGDLQALANTVESLTSNPERRQQEANVIRGSTGAYKRFEYADVDMRQDSKGRWFAPNIAYDTHGTRVLPLSRDYVQTVGGVLRGIDPRLSAIITSAAQPQVGPNRIGSHRHDVDDTGLGHTSDLVLSLGGKKLTPKEAPQLYEHVIEEMAAAGFTGIGHYAWGIHVGGGKPGFWGPSTTSSDANTILQSAYNRGRARANGGVDADPRFALVPAEDRYAIARDAQAERNRELAAQRAAEEAARQARLDQDYVGAYNGTFGKSDLDTAVENGTYTRHEDISVLDGAIRKYQEDMGGAANGFERMAQGDIFTTSTDDKKATDAMFTAVKGREAVVNADEDAFTRNVMPIVEGTRQIPPQLSELLTAAVRSTDPKRISFGIQALAQLEAKAPDAYSSLDEQLRSDVDFFNSQKGFRDEKELIAEVNGQLTPQMRAQRSQAFKDGKELLTGKNEYNLGPDDFTKEFRYSSVPGLRFTPVLAGGSLSLYGIQSDYRNYFLQEFSRSSNPEYSKAQALKRIKQNYGTFDAGGVNNLMKYPPQAAGYPMIDGSYDWIAEHVHDVLGAEGKLDPRDSFALVSDSQTQDEVQAYKAGKGPLPSYVIYRQDADGQPTVVQDENFQNLRMTFAPNPLTVERSNLRAERTQLQEAAKRTLIEADDARQHQLLTGTPIPQEILDNEKRAMDALGQVEEREQALPPQPGLPVEPLADPNATPVY